MNPKELSTRYNPKDTESKWYEHWLSQDYFHSVPDEREAFSIVIPPPNVTGVLHMGHMLNNTIQDILIRKARQEGKNACWVPGTDHASIATEAKVVGMLREKGIKKSDISREEFMKYAWEWKEKYGGIILNQLQKLGCSCDWKRTRFTLEDSLSRAVVQVFNDLYKKGRIYRGLRMTNWDIQAKTVLSNEEVIYGEENSRLFHVRYQIEGAQDEWVTIATTRPETILGDTAIAIHPKDERYQHLKGKKVIVPIAKRSIPIIFDRYVEMDFGTGCLKVTPAHDMNDYEIGQRHNLEVIDTINDDGTMSEAAGFYIGEDRFKARKLIIKDLEAQGHIVEIENYKNKVGRSERTNVIVEPKLTMQWFLKMDEFAATALKAVESGEVSFFPESMWNMYNSWLKEENVKDWCISRQLWWGQQIPAWSIVGGDDEQIFVAMNEEEALAQAIDATGNDALKVSDLKRDEDVVDTWFSSWLWPISVFDGFENQEELSYYYPTNVLVTGWDIMFFWVARMIMAGYEWAPELLGAEVAAKKGVHPFDDVFFTGMVRDNKRRKMSKSLGNSPDSLSLIKKYGADGVRFGILSCTSAGADIIFDAPIDSDGHVLNESKLCEQGRNFCNKMWNALRLIKGWNIEATEASEINQLATKWLDNKLNKVLSEVEVNLNEYRLSDAVMNLYKFIWDDFCSWYLEMIKPAKDGVIDKKTYDATIGFYEKMMSVLHPFMPFITEEIWHNLRSRNNGEDCIISEFPKATAFDDKLIAKVEKAKSLIAKVRETRNAKGIKMSEALDMHVEKSSSSEDLFNESGVFRMVTKMANLESLNFTDKEIPDAISFLVGTEKYFLEAELEIDVEAECERINVDLEYQIGFVNSVKKKLSNERFVNNAPEKVVENERKKLADGEARIKILTESKIRLGCK